MKMVLGIATIIIILIPTDVFGEFQFNTCGEPPPSSNTYRTFPDNLTVEYRCVDNFHLTSGNLTRTCVNGQFSGEAPVCSYDCGPPLNTSYAADLTTDGTNEGSTLTYLCPENSLVASSATTCDLNTERWKYGDQCYPDTPLDRSAFVVTGTTARLQDISNSTGEPLSETTPSSSLPEDVAMLGPGNAIDSNNSTSLLSGGCSSTMATKYPRYDITLDDFYDIYKIVITLPHDSFAYSLPRLIVTSRVENFSTDRCVVHKSPVLRGTVFVAECTRSRYGNYGKYISLTSSFDPMNGMLQICDLQIYGRPLKYIDCGQPDKIPYAIMTSVPSSTREGGNNKVTYKCIEGFQKKKGSDSAYCGPNGYWISALQCTDDENIAFKKAISIPPSGLSVQMLSDGSMSSCYVTHDVTNAEFIIDLTNTFEVSDVSVTFGADPIHLPSIQVAVNQEDERLVSCKAVSMKAIDGDTLNIQCPLYPVGRYVTVHVTYSENTTLEICEITVHGRSYTTALECYRDYNPRDYKGTTNFTVMGIPCQRWDSQLPHEHSHTDLSQFPDATLEEASNYCRNPNGRKSVWCYTTDPTIPWQYCPVIRCQVKCLLNERGETYRGHVRFTTSGTRCLKWKQTNIPAIPKSQFSHLSNNLEACRNPSVSQSKPWCYTSSDGTQYEHCNIPSCPTTPEVSWSYWVMHENQTLPDLVPASECHVWKRFWNGAGIMSGNWYGAADSNRMENMGVKISTVCKSGQVYNATVLCWDTTTDGAVWKGAVLECVDCGAPPNVTNATAAYIGTFRFSTAVYTCVPGYALASGSNNVTCLETGEWETPDMVCEPNCGDPPAVDNTVVSGTAGFMKDTANYTCLDGFAHISGSLQITCQENVTWEQPDIYCQGDCGTPPHVGNTTVVYNGTVVNSVAEYTCTDGDGTIEIQCRNNGSWENPGVVCTVDCGHPPSIENTTVIFNMTTNNSTAEYTCIDGYAHVTGSGHVRCQANGTWEIPDILCEVDCGHPPSIENTTVIFNTTTTNSTAEYTCIDGYAHVTGSGNVRCQANGTWEIPEIYCHVTESSTTTDMSLSTDVESSFSDVTSFLLDVSSQSTPDTTSFLLDVTSLTTPDMTSFISGLTSPPTLTSSLQTISSSFPDLDSVPLTASLPVLTSSVYALTTFYHVTEQSVSSSDPITVTSSTEVIVDRYGRTRSEVCICRCVKKKSDHETIIRNLTINFSELSLYRNKKISIPDGRPLSAGIGSFSVSMIIIMFSLFFANDLIDIIVCLKNYSQVNPRINRGDDFYI